jgi:hypothetical protein
MMMKKALTKVDYNKNLKGDCSGLYGDCTWLKGYCTRLTGDCSWLYGDCTWLKGNLDECEITEKDREKGIDISELVMKARSDGN